MQDLLGWPERSAGSAKITAFDNVDSYDGMVFEGNIQVHSMCSHHHLPFFGVAHVAYLAKPEGKIIGLSKLNRTVEFYSRRPQVQENLTMQIHEHLDKVLEVHGGIAGLVTGSDIEKRNFVGTLFVITAGDLNRVPSIANIKELYSLDHTAFIHVKTGNNTFGETHFSSLNRWPNLPALVDRY